MTIMRTLRKLALSGLTCAAACGTGDVPVADQAPSSPPPEATAGDAALSDGGPWMATSNGGTRVSLQPSEFPLNVGGVALAIQVHSAGGEPRVQSVDLISRVRRLH